MVELKAAEGELKAVLQITRVATGKTETVEIVGKVSHEEMEALLKKDEEEEK